jgi:hypothetical protein
VLRAESLKRFHEFRGTGTKLSELPAVGSSPGGQAGSKEVAMFVENFVSATKVFVAGVFGTLEPSVEPTTRAEMSAAATEY